VQTLANIKIPSADNLNVSARSIRFQYDAEMTCETETRRKRKKTVAEGEKKAAGGASPNALYRAMHALIPYSYHTMGKGCRGDVTRREIIKQRQRCVRRQSVHTEKVNIGNALNMQISVALVVVACAHSQITNPCPVMNYPSQRGRSERKVRPPTRSRAPPMMCARTSAGLRFGRMALGRVQPIASTCRCQLDRIQCVQPVFRTRASLSKICNEFGRALQPWQKQS
jgi:hypothetical protein